MTLWFPLTDSTPITAEPFTAPGACRVVFVCATPSELAPGKTAPGSSAWGMRRSREV